MIKISAITSRNTLQKIGKNIRNYTFLKVIRRTKWEFPFVMQRQRFILFNDSIKHKKDIPVHVAVGQ